MTYNSHTIKNPVLLVKKYLKIFFLLTLIILMLATCNSPENKHSITIGAAASLGPALQEISALYHSTFPERTILLDLASSGTIVRQIEQGAPIDLFFSAAESKMQILENQDLLLDGSRQTVLQNSLVLVVPADNEQEFTSITAALFNIEGKLAIGEPESVPAGSYARQWLRSLGIWESIQERCVYTSTVRQALVYTERGETAAGIIYGSDAAGSLAVRIVAIAASDKTDPITYPLAITRQSEKRCEAEAFINWLLHEESARKIFENHGFIWSPE